jgi:hypothetical protein
MVVGELCRVSNERPNFTITSEPSAGKITTIFIVFLPLRAFHLHPVAFARFVRRVFSFGHVALEPALAAFSE